MSETTKALFKDALYQVLDNKVFRLLVILILFLVLPTFLIAAKPDALVICFGWKEYNYVDVLSTFQIPVPSMPEDMSTTLIQAVQTLLVDQIGGTFGLIFAVAATAFFVPRMVEKGAADTVFSKPVSRWALLFSRYVAGLLFVGILTSVLVLGMYLGLSLNSGYSDLGFLWSVPVMVYKYAVLHAFSLLVAVMTRSSVAAILTTLMFFAFNGCVHAGWQVKEWRVAQDVLEVAAGEATEGDDPGALVSGLLVTLDVLHYTLPKTNDAATISQSLRRAIAERGIAFKDDESGLRVNVAPEGFEKQELTAEDAPAIALWTQPDGLGRITLKRWPSSERSRRTAAKELDEKLKEMGVKEVERERSQVVGTQAEIRRWTEPRNELTLDRETWFLNVHPFVCSLEIELESGWRANADHDEALRSFQYSFERTGQFSNNPDEFFGGRAAWGGELKYNLYFSIASTLAFILLLLVLANWKLSRIDF